MSTTQRICIFISLFLTIEPLLIATTDDGGTPPLTAYNVLQAYDFPVGILPMGVTHYEINKANAKFNPYFNSSCSFSIEGSYQLRYKLKINGYISKDKLTSLSGLNIGEVKRNGDKREFFVGILSTKFGINNFYESPRCGCGFNWKSIEKNRQKRGPPALDSSPQTTLFQPSPASTSSSSPTDLPQTTSNLENENFNSFNFFEEEFQVELALAINVSDQGRKEGDPETAQINAAKQISLGGSPSQSLSEFLSLRYWAITSKGGYYLEAPVSGSRKPAEDGPIGDSCC
ncbi:unnamed protein product [Fraxinus pennsylvanica]|uniref:Uncharacterized protein n=1 Tax=Fraxinus pennsylvanica TaxID=56036 RepID=A0AAD2DME3_9LAMI|nr:unnamed protein product [Fraxinus pennsylvanica]